MTHGPPDLAPFGEDPIDTIASPSLAVGQAAQHRRCPNQLASQDSNLLPAILVTNDDGLDPGNATVLDLAGQILEIGYHVVVVAPGKNNSACGQKITLGRELTLSRHPELEERYGGTRRDILRVYSLDDGSPADCVIVAIEPGTGLLARLGLRPVLAFSGINIGPNLGPDIVYSGTFGAARQAAMYGVPAIASSIAVFGNRREDLLYAHSCQAAIAGMAGLACTLVTKLSTVPIDIGRLQGTVPVCNGNLHSPTDAVRSAFAAGDVLVNVNIPADWNGLYEPCELDTIFYRSAVKWEDHSQSEICPVQQSKDSSSPSNAESSTSLRVDADAVVQRVTIVGGLMEAMQRPRSDKEAVSRGKASFSTLSTWPALHPLAVTQSILQAGLLKSSGDRNDEPQGLPAWLVDS